MNNKQWVAGQWYHLNSARRAFHTNSANCYTPVKDFWRTFGFNFTCPIFQVATVGQDNCVATIRIPCEDLSFKLISVCINDTWLDHVRPFTPGISNIDSQTIKSIIKKDISYFADSATIDVLFQLGSVNRKYNLTSLRGFLNSGSGCLYTANQINFLRLKHYGSYFSANIVGHHNQKMKFTNGVRLFEDQHLPWWIGLVLHPFSCTKSESAIETATDQLLTEQLTEKVKETYTVSGEDKKLLDAVKYLISSSAFFVPVERWNLYIMEGEYKRGLATIPLILETAAKRKAQIEEYTEKLKTNIEREKEELEKLSGI